MKRQLMTFSMKNLLLLLSLAFLLFYTSSCDKDEAVRLNYCTAAIASQEVADAFAGFEAAIGRYADNPSPENNKAYEREARHYLEVLKDFESCAGLGDTREWQETIREVEAEVAMLQC